MPTNSPATNEPFLTGEVPSPQQAAESAKVIDDQLREIANGRLKPSKLSLDHLAKLVVFARSSS